MHDDYVVLCSHIFSLIPHTILSQQIYRREQSGKCLERAINSAATEFMCNKDKPSLPPPTYWGDLESWDSLELSLELYNTQLPGYKGIIRGAVGNRPIIQLVSPSLAFLLFILHKNNLLKKKVNKSSNWVNIPCPLVMISCWDLDAWCSIY